MSYLKLIFRLLFCLVFISAFHQSKAQNVKNTFDKPVYMHYMPWFDNPEFNGYWGSHWGMSNMNPDVIVDELTGKREIASHYYPLIGAYDSQDPDVIEYHLLLMKYSGVDGILINWYGTIGTNGDIDVLLENSNAIVDLSKDLDMDFSVIMEDRFVGEENGLNPVDYVHINIEYLKNNYFPKNNFIRHNNEPFFGIFGPIEIKGESAWNYALTAAGEDVVFLPLYWAVDIVGPGADGGYDWVDAYGIQSIENFYNTTAPSLDFAMGGAYPGFKDFYKEGGWGEGYFYLDHEDGQLLNQTIDLAKYNSSKIDALQLITWNDFGEGTMFEPTYEYGFKMLTQLQDKFGVNYSEFELQQIYRFYSLRKEYKDNASIQVLLDQVREYFVDFKVNDAIVIMDNIESENNGLNYYIINGLDNSYLFEADNLVKYGPKENSEHFKWKVEVAKDGYVYLTNVNSGNRIHIENQLGNLECTTISDEAWSSMWDKPTVDGTHLRLRNRWISNQFIHTMNSNGNVEHGTIDPKLKSGHWILKEADINTDLNRTETSKIIVSPNPGTGVYQIAGIGNQNVNLQVLDSKGTLINTMLVNEYSLIDISELNAGIYFFRLELSDKVAFKKIIKH